MHHRAAVATAYSFPLLSCSDDSPVAVTGNLLRGVVRQRHCGRCRHPHLACWVGLCWTLMQTPFLVKNSRMRGRAGSLHHPLRENKHASH